MKDQDHWKAAAKFSDLDPQYPTRATVDGVELAICLLDGEVHALSNICSHAFAFLSDGYIEGREIFCPLHDGSFDIRTGEAKAPPCIENIAVFDVRRDGDDILVRIP